MARAHERFAAERRRRTAARPRRRGAALPNLIVIGGLKCGTTSLHHYLNLHPEIAMSRPKELNFFVAELNWPLGPSWYASHFERPAPGPRRELAPLHEPAALRGRRRAHALGARRRPPGLHGPRPDRPHALPLPAQRRRRLRATARWPTPSPTRESAYVARSRYFFQLEPYLEAVRRRSGSRSSRREELKARPPGHDAPRVRLPRRRPRLHVGAVRARVGDRHGQGRRPLPAHGPGGPAPRPARPRPQLRPPARVAALAGRAGRPRPRRRRGAEARGPAGSASSWRTCSATTSPGWSSSPAASFGWLD